MHSPTPGRTKAEDNVLSLSTQAAQSAPSAPHMTGDATTSDAILAVVLQSIEDDKAEDIVQIDLSGKSEMGDHMVICSGRSTRQVSAISEKLRDKLKQELGVIAKLEGKGTGDWVLVDTGDVIVHVFRPEVREFYQLEKMWMDPAQLADPQKA